MDRLLKLNCSCFRIICGIETRKVWRLREINEDLEKCEKFIIKMITLIDFYRITTMKGIFDKIKDE